VGSCNATFHAKLRMEGEVEVMDPGWDVGDLLT
jgi:hypothetical protein